MNKYVRDTRRYVAELEEKYDEAFRVLIDHLKAEIHPWEEGYTVSEYLENMEEELGLFNEKDKKV